MQNGLREECAESVEDVATAEVQVQQVMEQPRSGSTGMLHSLGTPASPEEEEVPNEADHVSSKPPLDEEDGPNEAGHVSSQPKAATLSMAGGIASNVKYLHPRDFVCAKVRIFLGDPFGCHFLMSLF